MAEPHDHPPPGVPVRCRHQRETRPIAYGRPVRPVCRPELRTASHPHPPIARESRRQTEAWDDWVFKPALGRVGEDVAIRGVTGEDQWKRIRRAIRWSSGDWIAQRRFEAAAVTGPQGPVFPQVGVYTVDGAAVGIYGRLARRPLIDCWSQDVAIFIEE